MASDRVLVGESLVGSAKAPSFLEAFMDPWLLEELNFGTAQGEKRPPANWPGARAPISTTSDPPGSISFTKSSDHFARGSLKGIDRR